jgi:potassium-transporting ATPase KdpC subunit
MRIHLRRAAMVLLVFTILTGILYPFFVTLIAQGLFPKQAHGSLVYRDERALGSELIGQPFDDPKYFWGRPSATPGHPYNAAASNGSNLGPTNPALRDAVAARVRVLREFNSAANPSIPVDLVTTSASGLDPHISPAAGYYQVPRIARLRQMDEARVRALVDRHVEPPILGVLGERRLNVLRLNLALDELTKSGPS